MTWPRLWSIGRVDLGLSSREFWRLTPRMFNDLLGRRRQLALEDEYHFGVLATLIANHHPAKDQKLFEPWDFFPGLEEMRPDASDTPGKTPDQLLGMALAINASLGGKDLRRTQAR